MKSRATIEPGKTAPQWRPRERFLPSPKVRRRDPFHEVCRFKHFSARTEESYWGWVRRFLIFHKQGAQWRHPRELGAAEVHRFLGHLAAERQVSAEVLSVASPLAIALLAARNPCGFSPLPRAHSTRIAKLDGERTRPRVQCSAPSRNTRCA